MHRVCQGLLGPFNYFGLCAEDKPVVLPLAEVRHLCLFCEEIKGFIA